jgi:hypothetical protein
MLLKTARERRLVQKLALLWQPTGHQLPHWKIPLSQPRIARGPAEERNQEQEADKKKEEDGKRATNSLCNHLAAPANACGKVAAILIKLRTILWCDAVRVKGLSFYAGGSLLY